MPRTTLPTLLPLLALLPACPADAPIGDDPATSDMSSGTGENPSGDAPTAAADSSGGDPLEIPVGECLWGPDAPTRLAIVTNDFTAASLHVIDLASDELTADVAPATTDPALSWGDGMLALIGRFTFNSLEVLDGSEWSQIADLAVTVDGVAEPNPQALTFAADGRAYLTLLASSAVPIYDFHQPAADNPVGSLDLSAFADADGSPEAGVGLACGDVLFVGIQRLVEFVPVDQSFLVPVDLTAGAPIDLDPAADGTQAIPLQGPWPKQIRRDPADPSGHTALVLTSAIERVDLVTGAVSWAVTPERLAALEIDGFDPQSFAVSADGSAAYLVATDGTYPASAVFRLGLADESDAVVVSGLTTMEKVVEIAGDTLWIADADPADPHVRAIDLSADPPAEHKRIPLPAAPYLMLALP